MALENIVKKELKEETAGRKITRRRKFVLYSLGMIGGGFVGSIIGGGIGFGVATYNLEGISDSATNSAMKGAEEAMKEANPKTPEEAFIYLGALIVAAGGAALFATVLYAAAITGFGMAVGGSFGALGGALLTRRHIRNYYYKKKF